MNKKTTFSILAFVVSMLIPFSLTSCGEDIQVPDNPNNEEIENPLNGAVTEFTGSKTALDDGDGTRTSMDANRKFYWEPGDVIWLDEAKDGSFSTKLTESKLSNPTKAPQASFYLRGKILNGDKYDILYTGNDTTTTSPFSVTIAKEQKQKAVNNAEHFGASGDCGVAEATPNGNGKYSFVVKHKAAYLHISPYLASSMPAGLKLVSFQIVEANNKSIAGTYSFDKNGLKTLNVASPSNTIAFTCGPDGFPIKQADYSMDINGCYVVIQPGTHTLTINYTLQFLSTGANITISKTIAPREYKPGFYTYIHHELDREYTFDFPDMYYMWDAQEWYWYGVSNYPTVNGATNVNYPKSLAADPLRFYQSRTAPAQAEYSAASMPNINEVYWYVQGTGTIYWDATTPWNIGGRERTGGIWLKKKDNIPGFNKNTAPNGVDGTRVFPGAVVVALTAGKPSDTSGYFFLPAFGYVLDGVLQRVGTYGIYWFSSTIPGSAENGFNFDFAMEPGNTSSFNGKIWIDSGGVRRYGCSSGKIVAGLFK